MKTTPLQNLSVREISTNTNERFEEITRVSMLMQLQAQMPINPFLTRDEAYKVVRCDPRAAMSIFLYN